MAELRQYQPIWEYLKQHGSCKVLTSTTQVARLVKAVTKEKYMDIAFKVHYDARLTATSELSDNPLESYVTFRLTKISRQRSEEARSKL